MDYAIQYRPYGATRSQTNNPNRVALPNIVREGYENVREDYENTTTPQHSPERATLYSIVREGYEHENMNMPVQDAITQWESRNAATMHDKCQHCS